MKLSSLALAILLTGSSLHASLVPCLAQAKPPLLPFSQLKQHRALIPQKSGFETTKQYQDKIISITPSQSSVVLELPHTVAYDVENQQLKIKVETTYEDLGKLPSLDKLLVVDGSSYSAYKDLIIYREDQGFKAQENITCINGLGRKFYYKNILSQSTRYLINLSKAEKIREISLGMKPERARQYFTTDEKYINRFRVKITAHSVAPFYSSFSSSGGDSCPNTPILRAFADATGITSTYFYKNHLIHLILDKYEIVDSVTGDKIFSQSFLEQ